MGFTARLLAKDIVSAGTEDTVASAAARMAEAKVGAVVVLGDQGKLVGILTERDIAYRVAACALSSENTRVGEVMTPSVQTLQAEDPLEKVFEVLKTNAHRHLPVVDGKEIIGMVSLHDFQTLLEGLSRDQEIIRKFADAAISSPRQVFRLKKRA